MLYLSTRGGDTPVGFREAVLSGLARDGGLYLPESIPDIRDRLGAWRDLRYTDLATEIIGLFCDLPRDLLSRMVRRSYGAFRSPEVTPLARVGHSYVLELHHGPTLAFKDVALQFLGNLFEHFLHESGARLNILGATSGDTGSAAIHGVKGRRGMRIFMLHPHGRTSRVQELQMTTVLDPGVFNLAVKGTFDDCQAIVKSLFSELDFRDRHSLGAVNSINWARIVAQIVYYFYGAFRAMEASGAEEVVFSVPTGNFGDIFAGYMAARMGLPIRRLVLATNENDILARFFATGVYQRGEVHSTISPSMDIQSASNFERYLFHALDRDASRISALMKDFSSSGCIQLGEAGSPPDPLFRAGTADTARTLATIRAFHEWHNYLLDPHTAAGVAVGLQNRERNVPLVCLATAHPAKFGDAIKAATGEDLAHHPLVDGLGGLPTRLDVVPADVDAVREYVDARAGGDRE
jgi:threonine synthase